MTVESYKKPKTNNQQLLRNKLKLELKYEVNLRFETQIWKPGPDLKMKNLEMRSWIPGLNLKKNRLKPGKGHFLVYFKKSYVTDVTGDNFYSKGVDPVSDKKFDQRWKSIAQLPWYVPKWMKQI